MLSDAARAGQRVVAQFSATWCAPCQRIKPDFAALAHAHAGVRLAYIDIDTLGDVALAAGVGAIPHFAVYGGTGGTAKLADLVAPSAPQLCEFVAAAVTATATF